jgi:hypothetical protein
MPNLSGKSRLKILRDKHRLMRGLGGVLNIVLLLLILNLLSYNLGLFESQFIVVATVYLLIGVLLLNLPLQPLYLMVQRRNLEKHAFTQILVGLFFLVFAFAVLLFTRVQMLHLVSISVATAGLYSVLQGFGIIRKELSVLSVVSFVYALLFLVVQMTPLWHGVHRFSLWFSSGVGVLFNRSLLLGPSLSGLWMVICFLLVFIFVFFMGKKTWSRCRVAIGAILCLLVCWIGYLGLFSVVDFAERPDVVNLLVFLFILCLIPLFLFLVLCRFEHVPVDHPWFKTLRLRNVVRTAAFWSVVCLFISGVALTTFPYINAASEDDDKIILLYANNMLGTWDIPEYNRYGREASGMFGLLPIYLNLSGYQTRMLVENTTVFLNQTQPEYDEVPRYVNLTDYVTVIESSTLTRDHLADVDVFVVINLNVSFSSDEKTVIWEFVENGGSLLVLGDHTNVGGIQDPLNELLQPSGIRFRFDSALPVDYRFNWLTCVQLPQHPITTDISDVYELQMSVGASLTTPWSSQPFIVGRYGLSDRGNRSNEEIAFLGDYDYNSGEQLGDLILATATFYGDGKLVVFGDTSSFQNTALPYSYTLVTGVFSWLTSHHTATAITFQMSIALLFLLAACIIHLLGRKQPRTDALYPFGLSVALVVATMVNPLVIPETELSGNLVYIDSSHGERFSLEPFTDDSLNGFMLNLLRNNYQPLLLREFSLEKIIGARVLVFNAPTKPFTDDEVSVLKTYMTNGGFIILSTGYEDKQASAPLLDVFGFDIGDTPLGPVPYVEENLTAYEDSPKFVDSWPIIIPDDSTYRSFYNFTAPSWEPHYHLMVFASYGAGGLLLISDSQYLLNKNIESIYDYWPGNILFLKFILDELRVMGAGG